MNMYIYVQILKVYMILLIRIINEFFQSSYNSIKYSKMLTEIQEGRQLLKQYDIQDLSRSLIRQFFVQNHFNDSLKCFQNQDTKTHKKINKSALIKMLCMNNLVFNNKQLQKPLKSLLEILVSYLKDKFRSKIQQSNNESDVYTKKTQLSNLQNNCKDDYLEKMKLDKSLNNTVNLSKNKEEKKNHHRKQEELSNNNRREHKQKNQRPVTSGAQKNRDKNKNVQLIYAELAKQEIREQEKVKKLEKQRQKLEKQRQKLEEQRKMKQKQQIQIRRKNQQQKGRDKKIQEERIKEREKQVQKQQKQRKQRLLIQSEQIRRIQQEKQKQEQEQKEKEKEKEKEKREKGLEKEKQLREMKQKERKQSQQRKKLQEKLKKEQEESVQRKKQQEHKKRQQELKNKKIQQQKPDYSIKIIQPQISTQKVDQVEGPKSTTRMVGMRKIAKKKQQNQFILQKQQPLKQQKKDQPAPFIVNKLQGQKSNPQLQKKQEGPKIVTVFGKKKKLNEKPEQQPKKFKFDQNFVDEPLHGRVQKYQYEKIKLNKITVQKNIYPEINYRQKILIGNKKYTQKSITQQQAQQLKKVVFQGGPSSLPKSWYQGFILSPHPGTPYGLQQIQGGPCGIIAAIQCYFLKHLLHLAQTKSEEQMSNQIIRQNCLVAAITDMLMKCKSSDKIILALPPKSFSGTKIDLSNLRLITIDANNFSQAFQGIFHHKSYFIGKINHGVEVLMYCIVVTKGIQKIWQQIDIIENPLIGNHGHCTQELVNLFITGYASSNCFDGTKILDSQIKLKGIENKSQFGFLTIFQTLKYIQVGKNLKNPIYPFWIICKQFHYHVIFSNHYLISQNNNSQKFDIVYFDGLYNCGDRIIITLESYLFGEEVEIKIKDLPLIQQVMMTKWGNRKADWNGAIKIL